VTTVRFGSVGGLSDAGIYLADELGYFAAAGIAVDMQQINSAPTLVQSIAASQIDVAGISVTPGLFASVALKINLRIVGTFETSAVEIPADCNGQQHCHDGADQERVDAAARRGGLVFELTAHRDSYGLLHVSLCIRTHLDAPFV